MTLSRVLALALVASGAVAAADSPDTALSNEIRRVRDDVGRVVPDAQKAAVASRLQRATSALEAGRAYLALYELENPFEIAGAFAFVRASEDVTTLANFSARWKSIGEPRAGAPRDRARLPAIVEAIAASADARAPATYRASLPYAQDSDIRSGLYYLGESQAFGAFARFVRSMTWPSSGRALALRSIAPELDAFERVVTQAYQGMTPPQHQTYMLTSVALKRARALNGSRQYAAALFEYLLARYRFAPLRRLMPPAGPPPDRMAAARSKLVDDTDHSIARLFMEMADAALDSANAYDTWAATVIVDDVLPAYHAALRATSATEPSTAAVGKRVSITLVRWPFT